MIEFEIIQKIKVKTITEETIRTILLAEIQKQIPEATINGIEFVIKRNPTRVELEVDAQYGAGEPVTNATAQTLEAPVVDTVQAEVATEAPEKKPAEPKAEVKADVISDLLKVPKTPAKKAEPEVKKAAEPVGDVADMFKL